MNSPACYDASTPLIPAEHQPAVLLEHWRSLDLDPQPLWHGAGLSLPLPGDGGSTRLSPQQWLSLVRTASRTLNEPDLSFELGRQLLPGHYGAASHALLGAGNLRRALHVLQLHASQLSPLLVPHVVTEGRWAVLGWTDACASAGIRSFLVEMQMSAVAAVCQWLAGERLPWTFLFNRGAPARRDGHEAHLGSALRFGCHLDAMVIDASWLDRPWNNPRALRSPLIAQALDREAQAQEPRRHLLASLYDHLQKTVAQPPGLEQVALAFDTSPATFKRRLAACGTHFQAELDQARLHAALRLMHDGQALHAESIGRQLGLPDPANFRRAMKRWAGLTPVRLRQDLLALD